MTTLASPQTAADVNAVLGRSFDYFDAMVLERLVEKFDLLTTGAVVELGDMSGRGTDTARIPNATGYGWATRMSSMAGETSAITASALTAAYDSISIARKGLAFEDTFQRAILARDNLNLEFLANSVADSWLATLRYMLCVQGATFTTNAFDDTATTDVDDAINLRNLYENTDGFVVGGVSNFLHPIQMKFLRASIRSESAFKFPDAFAQTQGLQSQSGYKGNFLDMKWFTSKDVVLNTDYYGFSCVDGALGYAVASTAALAPTIGPSDFLLPRFGLSIHRKINGQQAMERIDANAWLGVTSLSATVAPQFLLRSNAS